MGRGRRDEIGFRIIAKTKLVVGSKEELLGFISPSSLSSLKVSSSFLYTTPHPHMPLHGLSLKVEKRKMLEKWGYFALLCPSSSMLIKEGSLWPLTTHLE